jgi:hypothetical protein
MSVQLSLTITIYLANPIRELFHKQLVYDDFIVQKKFIALTSSYHLVSSTMIASRTENHVKALQDRDRHKYFR